MKPLIQRIEFDDYADEICELNRKRFIGRTPAVDDWFWIAHVDGYCVAFASMRESSSWCDAVYMSLCVVREHFSGMGLQRRLLRARIRFAKAKGYSWAVTDTTDNPASANNLIRCGFNTFMPSHPWAYERTIYWKKWIGPTDVARKRRKGR